MEILPAQADLNHPDVAISVCQWLLPFHPAAASSRLLRNALADQAVAMLSELRSLECSIIPSFAPRILGVTRFQAFAVRRATVAESAARVCPEGCCGSETCERSQRMLAEKDVEEWLDDLDWPQMEPKGPPAGKLEEVIRTLGQSLPAFIVEHTHFETREYRVGERRLIETHDVHCFLPIGRRAVEFAFSTEFQR
mmetsp:Transcript_27490/g.64066  ORF Transcript_27490/g.64066 Transcript_27490/m.64066 type:complete len:195 (+) Transcript_27490:48-632(+)